MTRGNILGAFQVLVSGHDPIRWWQSLTQDRGDRGAAKAVAQLVIAKGGKRVLDLIRAEAPGRSIFTGREHLAYGYELTLTEVLRAMATQTYPSDCFLGHHTTALGGAIRPDLKRGRTGIPVRPLYLTKLRMIQLLPYCGAWREIGWAHRSHFARHARLRSIGSIRYLPGVTRSFTGLSGN